jgi:hypothetical protein
MGRQAMRGGGNAMLELTGKNAGEYFVIVCATCGEETDNEYLGYDPAVPHFKAVCKQCGTSGIWKLTVRSWTGLPADPDLR